VPQVQLIHQYVQLLQFERGLAVRTVAKYADDLDKFSVFVEGRGKSFVTLDRADCQDWLKTRYGFDSAKTANGKINLYKQFYEYLKREGVVKQSPFVAVMYGKTPDQDIGAVMSVAMVVQLLEVISNIRDRAMFELMYASGLRISELVNIKVNNIHVKDRFVQVMGKGRVERIVPVGDIAMSYVVEYIQHHRPDLVTAKSQGFLFLTRTGSKMGSQMSNSAFYQMMMRYMAKAGIAKVYSPHSIRHAFATHLMNAGVDILTISKMLGHRSVNTTDIYTHVARDHLKAFIEKHHPLGKNYVKFVRFT
jgi:integrase/recombinase XerD